MLPKIIRLSLVGLMVLFGAAMLFATELPDKTKGVKAGALTKTGGTPLYQILNINNITSWMRSDGQSNHSPSEHDGAYYPRGTANVLYEDGIMWGGKAYLDAAMTQPGPVQVERVGGSTYNTGTRAGRIVGMGAAAVAANPADADVRIYRIRRDYAIMTDDDLRRDAAESFEIPIGEVTDAQMAQIKSQYETDWNNWPVVYGAPYIDRNNNGTYEKPPAFGASFNPDSLISQNRDEPGIAGSDPNSPADQVIWTVTNDLDRSASLGLYGSEPLGLEAQITVWGYKGTSAIGNLYFRKARIINKGGVDIGGGAKGSFYIDSMYVAQWSDPDLGDSGDDLSGCDSTISIGFVYNGNANDANFKKYGLPPPAVAYDFLQGPMVPGAATDSAVFNLKRRYGMKNLGLTSFAYFSAGSGISDPAFSREGGLRWWKMLQGFVPDASTSPKRLYPHPPGYPVTKFPLSGDPVNRTGFIDGQGQTYSFAPGDRRIVLNSGPFTLAPGDTQELVVGTVAGIGADRISSVAVMKFNDRFVQNTYDALFQVPKAPVAPDVKVAELDGEVVLEWGSNLQRVVDTEDRVGQPGGYAFEGYNIYQLPGPNAQLSEATRILTYDLETDPTVVLDEQFDVRSGQILRLPVHFGANSGVKRYFSFKRDYIRDIDKVYNGQQYYLAVTAYSVSTVPGYLPAALESTPQILTVRPRVPFGKNFATKHGDTLSYTKTGSTDGAIRPIVIDPAVSTGDTYEVRFADAGGGATTWSLMNKTKNKTLTSGETNQSGDDRYKIFEGIYLKVEGPPPGMKDWDIPNGQRRFTWADGYTYFEGFETTIGWDEPAYFFGSIDEKTVKAHELKNVLLKLAAASSGTATNPNAGNNPYGGWDVSNPGSDPNFSYGYRYLRGATGAPARPEFAPYVVNATAGYAYQDYKRGVPLSAWNVEANPPVRLAVGHLENNVATGLVDGKWWPGANGTGTAGNQGSTREWLFIFDRPYTDATPAAELQKDILNNGLPVMWWLGVNRRGGANFSAGDEFLILANHVNTPSTVFSFTAPAPESGTEVEKQSANKIGVFPNPYYAMNTAETNRFFKFVTFNNLPPKATFRIFNMAGQLVRTLEKNDPSQFFRWDLNNQNNFPVASGIYVVYLDLPDLGMSKVLKVAIIQEQEVLDVF